MGFDYRTSTGLEETGTSLQRAHKGSCVHQDAWGKNSGPIGEWARPACWHWRVSCRGGRWLWITVWTKSLATEILGSTHWLEPSQRLPLATPSACRLQCWLASCQTTNRVGTQPHSSADKWIKVLLGTALPTRGTRPSPTHHQTLPSGSLHKPLR